MSVLFGLYQPEEGKILKNGKEVAIRNPNDANALGIGMVHQHFKLVECFSVLDNIILGVEPNKMGFLQKAEARKKVMALSEKYGLRVDPDALVSDISVGMQQRVEILKMLYRDNEILIFDEPTAVLTPQEIDELMEIMRGFKKEGKSILFITHKLNEIMAVADRCTVLRKGFNGGYKYRRIQVTGDERYTDEPVKNGYSHPHDGLQYVALHHGGSQAIKAPRQPRQALPRFRQTVHGTGVLG
jgi:simple sugar transport system ATP-binding protein